MKKGIIMEMDDSSLTLLTPEGEFLHAKRQDRLFVLGEEIHFFPIENFKTSRLSTLKNILKVKPVWVVSIVAALMIFFGSFIPIYQDNKAYAYMSIDVNPSIELGINKKMQVVELTGFNKEGNKVISSIEDWKKKDVSKLTKAIIINMKKDGFLNSHKSIIISTVHTTKPVKQVEAKLKKNLEDIKATVNNQQLAITVYNSTEQEREKAQKLGITTGKYHEEKVDALIKEKKQAKPIEEKKSKLDKMSSKESVVPPGQLKKQTETNSPQVNNNQNNKVNEKSVNPIPPGQVKKTEDFQEKQNDWKKKSKLDQKENTNQEHSLNKFEKPNKTNKSNQPSKSNHQEKSNQNNKHNK